MNNKEICDLLVELGMLEPEFDIDKFINEDCASVAKIMNFVNDLFMTNDEAIIKDMLVCILHANYLRESACGRIPFIPQDLGD